jgi:hypothetical protein
MDKTVTPSDGPPGRVLLVQLPIPQLNFGRRTGNIPLSAACLKQAAEGFSDARIDILPESTVTYLEDAELLERIPAAKADIVGFTVYGWNLCRQLKEHRSLRIVFGGPEITADNAAARSEYVDFYVWGDGEVVFRRLLTEPAQWRSHAAAHATDATFGKSPSAYTAG